MKRLLNYGFGMGMMLMMPAAFTGCSDDEPINKEEDSKFPEMSDEMMAKLHQIYDNASTGPQQVKTVNQLAILTSICASIDGNGPITVTPITLNGEDMTLVTLGGTQDVEGQATSMEENQLASFGKPNDYLTAVTCLFANGTVPQGKPVILSGISLGGMIAQQMLGVDDVTSKFTLKAVITFGSPITLPLDRKGVRVIRFADVNDKVPQLGEMILRGGLVTGNSMSKDELKAKLDQLDQTERIARSSKYTGMIETHALSYIEDPCWSDVDFMGDTGKKNVMVLKSAMKFYPAPTLKKE